MEVSLWASPQPTRAPFDCFLTLACSPLSLRVRHLFLLENAYASGLHAQEVCRVPVTVNCRCHLSFLTSILLCSGPVSIRDWVSLFDLSPTSKLWSDFEKSHTITLSRSKQKDSSAVLPSPQDCIHPPLSRNLTVCLTAQQFADVT